MTHVLLHEGGTEEFLEMLISEGVVVDCSMERRGLIWVLLIFAVHFSSSSFDLVWFSCVFNLITLDYFFYLRNP